MFKNIILAVAVIGFSPVTAKTSDRYHFEEAQFTNNQVNVNVISYDNADELERTAMKYNIRPDIGNIFNAFSVVNVTAKTCTIHILTIKTKYDPATLGHEMAHCMYGNFHKSQHHD